jgi:dihydropteroate synthase
MPKYKPFEWRLKQHTLEIGKRTLIMGILNVTPDSFSDGGKFDTIEHAIEQALEMAANGADIIDIGGESTRPGHGAVPLEIELSRVIPVIEALVAHPEFDVPISIDTYKAETARQALLAGAEIVNDIWGLQREPQIARVAAEFGAPVIIMHNQDGTHYETDMVDSMIEFFEKSLAIAREAGIPDSEIMLDPGFGFGKTSDQNILLMPRLHELHVLGFPLLLGTSRKSMIGKILDLPPAQRVEGTVATSVFGVIQGVEVIRVHDVIENLRAVRVIDAMVRRDNLG